MCSMLHSCHLMLCNHRLLCINTAEIPKNTLDLMGTFLLCFKWGGGTVCFSTEAFAFVF